MADDDINVRIRSDSQQLNEGLQEAKEKIKEFAQAAVGAFAVDRLFEFIEKLSDVGEQIERINALTGVSGELFQELAYAMTITGGSSDSLGPMFNRLEANVETAASGSGKAFDAFRKLGVSLDDLRHMNIDDLTRKMVDGFHDIDDAVERSSIARDVGGRGFAAMLPAIMRATKGTEEFKRRLQELNDDLSNNTVKALSSTHTKIEELGIAAQGAGVQGMLTFKGAIDGVLENFTYALVDIGKFIGWLRELQNVAGLDLVEAFLWLGKEVKRISTEMEYYGEALQIKWELVGRKIKDIATGNFEDIALADAVAEAKLHQAALNMGESLKYIEDHYKELKKAAEDAAEAIAKADSAAGVDKEAGKANRGGGANKQLLEQEAALFKAKIDYEEQLEKGHYDKLLELQQQLVDKMAQLYGKDSKEWYAAMQKKVQIQQEADTKAEAYAHKFFQSIEHGMDTMLDGVLMGTQTWKQAMGRLFSDLALSFIKDMVIKPELAWIESQYKQLMATTAKNVAVTASNSATAAAGLAEQKVGAQASVGMSAGQAAASVYADVAAIPYIGWLLAPPAAAAAFVAVEAFGAFEKGSDYVPMTGLAMVHKGETIIPASEQGSPYSGGGQGDTFHVSIQAVDAQSFAQLCRSNPSAITSVVAGAARNGNSHINSMMKQN